MPKRTDKSPPFNPEVLKWAREWREISLDEAAHALSNKRAADILDWESRDGETFPTVKQARKLADLYQRPFLEFFMREPPPIARPQLVPDFRLYHDAPEPSENRDFLDIQSWAESLRINALDLYEDIGEEPPNFPGHLITDIESDPAEYAALAREACGFSIEEQCELSASERYKLPSILKIHVESIGVLVAKETSLSKHGARGLCLAIHPLPVIVFGKEAPAAQAFTVAHELGHILVEQSGIIGAYAHTGNRQIRRIESWCNHFAAAFLMPEKAVAELLQPPESPQDHIDDDTLGSLARHFSVSPHALLIRLVHLGYVQPAFYWERKRPEFLDAERNYKGGGRSTYFGSRYRSRVGDHYTGLVLEAWNLGRITGHNAAEFMGIKNMVHLHDIKNNFGA